MKNTLVNLVHRLLLKNQVSFDKRELAFQIKSHPSYPSLHAITDVLDHFNIENIAAEIPKNKASLASLPSCFLAQISTGSDEELVVVVRSKLDFLLYYSSQKKEKITELDFLKVFTGIVVAVESNSLGKPKSNKNTNALLTGVLVLLVVGDLFISKSSILSSLFFFSSVLGVLISMSIYKEELGVNTVLGNAFCAAPSEKKDCDAVLGSNGAVVFKDYKLSDFSLIYFLSTALSSFLILIKNGSLDFLFVLGIMALPVTIYSIYYQLKIVKKWCYLCISIVGLLWFQSSLTVFNGGVNLANSFDTLFFVALSFIVVIIAWNLFKREFKSYQDFEMLKINHVRFKRNFSVFSTLLNTSPTISTNINDTKEIIFGNEHSKLEIVVITNPFCGHCKPVHKMIDDILVKYKKEVKIIIRFNINTSNTEGKDLMVASRLLELYHSEKDNNCLEAMNQIYKGEPVLDWVNKWGSCNKRYVDVLEKEKMWCLENSINFTPEILINGQSFPKEYERTELLYFIEELHENSCKKKNNELITLSV